MSEKKTHDTTTILVRDFHSEWFAFILKTYQTLSWDWHYISASANMKWEFVQHYDFLPWDWYELSKNPVISYHTIRTHSAYPWKWLEVISRDDYRFDYNDTGFMQLCTDYISFHHMDIRTLWYTLSLHHSITPDIVRSYPEINWHWRNLTHNFIKQGTMTLDFVHEYREKDLAWDVLTLSPVINLSFIIQHHYYRWDWYRVSQIKGFTWSLMYRYPHYHWSLEQYIQSDEFDFHFVVQYPSKQWNWNSLSCHEKITWDMIYEHLHFHWNWYYVSLNPNISWDIVESHPHIRWNMRGLSRNLLEQRRLQYDKNKHKEYMWNHVFEEMIRVLFHPSNMTRIQSWGFLDE